MARVPVSIVPELPNREGTVAIAPDRCLGFAEFGDPEGRPVIWLHGTPGARRQIPPDAPAAARARGIRIIAVERPGTGLSTRHRYPSVRDFAADMARFAEAQGLGAFAVVGLSGGGPYALACAHELPERVVVAAVLNGVAPLVGRDAIHPRAWHWLERAAPLLDVASEPVAWVVRTLVRVLIPLRYPAIDLYARLAPKPDRPVLREPRFRHMFVEDLANALREDMRAPIYDLVLFLRDWGFSLRDIRVPVRFWQGADDGIVPPNHCAYQASLIADARLVQAPGEGHFAGFSNVTEVLTTVAECWAARERVA